MDQKRLFIAIAVSVAILLGFQLLVAPHLPQPPAAARSQVASTTQPSRGRTAGRHRRRRPPTPPTVPEERAAAADRRAASSGSISLLGARLDDLVLTRLSRDAGARIRRMCGCWSRCRRSSPTTCSTAGAPAPASR